MEQPAGKKKKHWVLRLLCLLLVAALLAAVVLGIRTVPRARRLQRALTAQNCAVTVRAQLNRDGLSADQLRLLETLSGLMGMEESEWNRLTLQGGYDGHAIRLAVCGGQGVRLTELYLTQDCQAIDMHAIYDRAYSHLTGEIELLALVLPQWGFGDYISMQQLEQAFGLELGELPDFKGKLEKIQAKLSLPLLCGAVLAADEWDRERQELVYHITDTDRRLALARRLAKQSDSWQLPEGMELDVAVCLGESQVRTVVTGYLPGMEQLEDWSLELTWEGYVPESDPISMVEQQVIDDLAELLKLLETLRKQWSV